MVISNEIYCGLCLSLSLCLKLFCTFYYGASIFVPSHKLFVTPYSSFEYHMLLYITVQYLQHIQFRQVKQLPLNLHSSLQFASLVNRTFYNHLGVLIGKWILFPFATITISMKSCICHGAKVYYLYCLLCAELPCQGLIGL